MKTAIVYYSMSGNTKYAAEKIAQELNGDCIQLEPVKAYPSQGAKKYIWGGKSAMMGEKPSLKPYEFHEDQYDRIILATPVWASSFAPPVRTFIAEHPGISNKKIAALICFKGGGGDKALEKMRTCLGIDHFEAELILIDPKDQPDQKNQDQIHAFCEKLI